MSFRTHYSASNRDDIDALYRDMMALSNPEMIAAQILVMERKLMLPLGIFKWALMFVSLRGARGRVAFIKEHYRREPQKALALWKQTADHVLKGKDREDRDSVGGWSQREIDLFCEIAGRVFGTHTNPQAEVQAAIHEMDDEDAVLAVARTLSPYGTAVQIQRDVHRLTGRNLGISRIIHILDDWEQQKQVTAVDGVRKTESNNRRQTYFVTHDDVQGV